jgi:hypothetical protein
MAVIGLMVAAAAAPAAQSPRPFPLPPSQPANTKPVREPPAAPLPLVTTAGAPTEASLGVPLYPNAHFLTSYDAGRGQRYYLFGVAQTFTDIVAYYQGVLKTRGDLLFDIPATHAFETGRFRDDAMAFPPSVTVKDFVWNGSPGYANPKPGVTPTHFPTIIQIVPAPPATVR